MPRAASTKRIKSPYFIELAEQKDLARLVCAFERVPLPVLYFETEQDKRMAAQLDLFMGRPILYYVKVNDFKHYLGYRNSSGIEEVVFSDSTTSPTYIYAPIIFTKRLPSIFYDTSSEAKEERYLSVEVKDLNSLAKVGSYKVYYEEPPLPFFAFPSRDRWVLGTFTRMDEYEEASMFFYMSLDAPPPKSFVRYSSQRTSETTFTNRVDEHGYVYLKVIKLVSQHPLVDV